jgi:hypothetical protein
MESFPATRRMGTILMPGNTIGDLHPILRDVKVRPLFAMRLASRPQPIGATPGCVRRIFAVTGGVFEGAAFGPSTRQRQRLADGPRRRRCHTGRAPRLKDQRRRDDRHGLSGNPARVPLGARAVGPRRGSRPRELLFSHFGRVRDRDAQIRLAQSPPGGRGWPSPARRADLQPIRASVTDRFTAMGI